jgi:hypothetical protein
MVFQQGADAMADFNDFKNCCRIEANLDLEALDVAFFQPIMDICNWFRGLPTAMQAFVSALASGAGLAVSKGAFAKLLEKALKMTSAEAAGTLAGALVLLAGTVGLIAVITAFQVCLDRLGLSPKNPAQQ